MGQALSFCKECLFKRDCDTCQELHDWIMEALEEKAELQAYRDTGLEPGEILKEAGYLKQTARRYAVPVDRLQSLAQADRDGRLVVLPFQQGRTLIDYSDPQRPELLKNFHVAISYNHHGIIFHQPFNVFMENVRVGYIAPVTKEAETVLKGGEG